MDVGGDPFASLSPGELNGAAASRSEPNIKMPAPVEPPAAHAIKHHQHGAAVAAWTYRDASGAPLMAAARFNLKGQHGARRKEVLPLAYMTDGRAGWRFGVLADHRPIYGLDRLAEEPHAPVLIVEGEKTADAAQSLFLDHVAVTSQGGSKAAGKADWTPLRGRDVII